MALSSSLNKIVEYRGVSDLVFAEVTNDDNETGTGHGYVTGTVYALAGVAEISKETDSSNEAHYYDNMPAVIVSNTAADVLTISASAIPLEVMAEITGQTYVSAKGAYIEGQRVPKYFALGYRTKQTDGTEIFVWRYKGSFNVPGEDNVTENAGTDANGQQIVYTGISTTHKFTAASNKGAKAMYVDTSVNTSLTAATFFGTVTTPDNLS